MNISVGKWLVASVLGISMLTFFGLSRASAACDPALGALLCPPPPTTPDPPAPPPPPQPPAPAPAPQPEPDPAPAIRSVDEAKARLLALINGDRTEAGLAALASRDDLDDLADAHSTDMAAARRIFHNDELFTEATKKRIGAKTVGENVASNTSIDEAHRRLMASPSHRANLLSKAFTQLGLGLVDADGTWYLTEVFVTPVGSTAPAAPAAAAASPKSSAPTAAGVAARTTSRVTTPRAARTDRPATTVPSAADVEQPKGEPAADGVVLDIDLAPDGQASPTADTSALGAPRSSKPSTPTLPLVLVALALVLSTGMGVLTVTFRRRTNRPMPQATWHPFSSWTISPMSGS